MLDGELEMHRDGEYLNIVVVDTNASVRVIRIRCSLEVAMQALTGMGCCECEYELGKLDLVGKMREHKREDVYISWGGKTTRDGRLKLAQEALKEHEVEGWTGDAEDVLNHHNVVSMDPDGGGVHVRVRFQRWVGTAILDE